MLRVCLPHLVGQRRNPKVCMLTVFGGNQGEERSQAL